MSSRSVHVVLDDVNVASELRIVRVFDEGDEHDATVFAWKRALELQGSFVMTETWGVDDGYASRSREFLSTKLRIEWGAPRIAEIEAALKRGELHPSLVNYQCDYIAVDDGGDDAAYKDDTTHMDSIS